MKKITQEELNEIVRKHYLWLEDEEGGESADLSNCDLSGLNLSFTYLEGANLTGANLSGANLKGADLSGVDLLGVNLVNVDLFYTTLKETGIITFIGPRHDAYYFPWNKEVKIGCQQHSLDYWLANYVDIGEKYIYTDRQIEQYGTWLKNLNN